LPWGVLFGGGSSLASAVTETGVDEWIGNLITGLKGVSVLLLVAVVTASILLLTELTSNTATAATFLPIVAGAAVGLDLNPLVFVVPAALALS
jgi:sodium-dependent dicarboxylate transporter 2/3/5